MRHNVLKALVGLFVATSAACLLLGSVKVTGSVGGRTVSPQTIFAFLDASNYESSDGKLVLKDREKEAQVLHVRLDGAAFDPTVDARFLELDELFRISQERTQNGMVMFHVRRAGLLADGKELNAGTGVDAPADTEPVLDFKFPGTGFGPDLVFGASQLENEALPTELPPLASNRTVKVKIDTFGKKPGEVTKGKITIEWKKNTDATKGPVDPEKAIEGKIDIEFEAEMIGERLGECGNLEFPNSSSSSSSEFSNGNSSAECNDFAAGG